MTRVALFLIGALVVLIGAPGTGAEKRVIAPAGVKPIGPYSPGILAGDFLYVSGQGGRDADGKLPDTIEGQVRQTLQNVKAIVAAAGLTMEHVVYSQVYLTDMAHHDVMDRVWKEFFPKTPPARAVLGVYKLPTDIAVEINAVAFRDVARKRRVVPAGYPQNLSWSPGMFAGNRLFLSGFWEPTSRRQDAARSGRAGAACARQHEADAGRGRDGFPPRRVRQPVSDGQSLEPDE